VWQVQSLTAGGRLQLLWLLEEEEEEEEEESELVMKWLAVVTQDRFGGSIQADGQKAVCGGGAWCQAGIR
jgi:hypothetical protein